MTDSIRFSPFDDELASAHMDTLITNALERIRVDQTLRARLARMWRIYLAVAAFATISVPLSSRPFPPMGRHATRIVPASALLDPALRGVAVGIDDAFVLLRPATP